MMYIVSDATKVAMVTPTSVNFGLQMGVDNVYNMEGLMGVDTSDVRKTIMFLMEGHRPTPICVPFEMFADEIHWELFANLFCSIYEVCANISSKWDSTNSGPVHPTYAAAYNLCEGWILHPLTRITIDPWMEELILHHGKKHMLKTCTHDRMIGEKPAKRSNSGATAKKTTFLDETNHATVFLTPKEDD